ncbi:hypothetical protein NRB15_06935 [Pseudomonas alliivorans]|uniref:hypothetical protein n=1 Tax=Pseudomonas alliivorans TaxID=2810613 RepID=UPI00211CA2FA|nr:hypothetical protein [Pseudomonas alliivorans]MCQ9470071.1 hypothetical protein [Pseudomonas alliivorans]
MEGNSLESLLAWMKVAQNNVMNGWGAIAILGRKQVNDLLALHRIARLAENAWLPPVAGSVDTIAGKQRDAIHGFLLDAPQLSFEGADRDSDHATLSCAVLAGTWMTLTLNSGNWQVRTIKEVNPLLGPRLLLDVNLTNAPGQVEVDGRIMLDLQHSDAFRLTHAGTEDEQRLVGDIFKKAFTDLPQEQRVFVLGRIEADEGETTGLMKPQAFILRAQAAPGSSHSVTDVGAILVCISMQGQPVGSTIPSGYPYFIPDDAGKNYSATVLFEGQMLPNALLTHIAKSFGSPGFSFQYDEAGAISQARLTSGQLTVPPVTFEETDPETGEVTVITVHEMALRPDAEQPVEFHLSAQEVRIKWAVRSPVNVSYKDEEDATTFPFEVGLAVEATYELSGLEWTRTAYTVEKTYFDIDQGTGEKVTWSDLILILIEIIITGYQYMMLDHISRSLDPVLEETLPASQGPEAFLDKNIKLGFDHIIESDSLHYPRDVAVFGRINPALTHFVVSPLQPVIAAGSSQQFSVTPNVQGVVWSLEGLHGSTEPLGTINSSSGVYQTPALGSVSSAGVRVRVVATHSSTGHVSAALVTVVVNQLSVGPVIQVCEVNGTVELAAQSLGDEPVQWSVHPSVPGQGGTLKPSTLPDGDQTYVAGPVVGDTTYALDEVSISNARGSRSAWVLVVNHPPALTVKPVASPEVSTGRIQLQAVINNTVVKVDWTLPIDGTGFIDDEGLYTGPEVVQQPFVLVFATLTDDILGTLEGHIILPLPLQQFPEELALMAAPASRRSLPSLGKAAGAASAPGVSAGNSVENIVAWMKNPDNNVMWGWGVIAALARANLNTLLLLEYIKRFSSEAYLPPISAEVQTVEDQWKEVLDQFILDAPRLSFTNDDLGQSRATLTCVMLGGTQLTQYKNVNTWEVERLICIDPLQGPRLVLNLRLDEVPGLVDAEGGVHLDLKHSDDFILTFAHTERERKLGGDLFKDLFNALPDNKRIWKLGSIRRGSDELLHPQSFKMRTQSAPQASRDTRAVSYGDGAVLLFIRMEGSQEGGDVPAEYRYLIPDNAYKDYSATVLFEAAQAHRTLHVIEKVVQEVSSFVKGAEFTYTQDATGRITKAVAKNGYLELPSDSKKLLPGYVDGTWITPRVDRTGSTFDARSVSPITITLNGDNGAVLTWKAAADEGAFIYLEGSGFDFFVAKKSIEFNATCTYEFLEVGNDLVIKPTLSVTFANTLLDYQSSLPIFTPAMAAFLLGMSMNLSMWDRDRGESRLAEALRHELKASLSVSSSIKEMIDLNFSRAIVPDVLRAPRDIAAFGRVNPTGTQFTISPVEHVMGVDTWFSFVTNPQGVEVTWSIDNPEGDSTDFGAISGVGKYYAPGADALEKTFTRVRVTATDAVSSHQSSALVTVLAKPLTVNPLIQVCDAGQSVELAGGGLGGANLTWSINNPVAGESGELQPSSLPDSDWTYQSRAVIDAKKTYVLDEIVVVGAQTRASAWVLVRHADPTLTISAVGPATSSSQTQQIQSPAPIIDPVGPAPSSKQTPQNHHIQLQALVNNKPQTVVWSIAPGGPGTIDDNGLYTVVAQKTPHFVLIFGALEHPIAGTMEGHIILPLPLLPLSSKRTVEGHGAQ